MKSRLFVVPDNDLFVLLDQNVPISVKNWLQQQKPSWKIQHVSFIGFDRHTDIDIFNWAQDNKAAIITFDEDFADIRMIGDRKHYGIIRLRIWPTTFEETISALEKMLDSLCENDITGNLIIIDSTKIRIRRLKDNS